MVDSSARQDNERCGKEKWEQKIKKDKIRLACNQHISGT